MGFKNSDGGAPIFRDASDARRAGAGKVASEAVKDPILQAADIQAEALQEAIPLFDPFREAGLGGLERFEAASTPQGLDELIAGIMSGDLFGSLVDERERAVRGQLAVGGLTRSGAAIDEAAAIPTDVALALEGMLTGRSGSLADTGFAGTSNIADLTTRVGEAIASGILGLEAQKSADRANRRTNRSNLLGSIIGGAFSGFSDPRLKEDITVIGQRGPLDVVVWKWKAETEGTIVDQTPPIGFLSTQVKEHFPHLVSEFGGYDVIDYDGLYRELSWH